MPADEYLQAVLLGRDTLDAVDNAAVRALPAGDHFAAHLHSTVELIICTEGSITLTLFRTPVTLAPGEYLAVYWLENGFGSEPDIDSPEEIESKRKRWERLDDWSPYLRACQAVWDDLAYFPVADCKDKDLSVTFENSWMFERSYNGDRVHEGTDLMPSVNERERFPIVSMTDGVVEQMGWLELGGWRIGIRAPHGGYFYYAHLSSYADLEVGDTVRAGDFLGYMGDTGYSTKEGTTGKFPVHLHLGIYLNTDTGEEISVNPYPALKYTEENKISFKGFHTL